MASDGQAQKLGLRCEGNSKEERRNEKQLVLHNAFPVVRRFQLNMPWAARRFK